MPVKIIKDNETYLKLKCVCGREFWMEKSNCKEDCPSCGIILKDNMQKAYRLKIRCKLTSDYLTIYVVIADDPINALSKLFDQVGAIMVKCSAFTIEAMSTEEAMTPNIINNNTIAQVFQELEFS